jgi:hypothetical protein
MAYPMILACTYTLTRWDVSRDPLNLAYQCRYNPPPSFDGDKFVRRACAAPYLCNVNMCAKDVFDSSKVWLVNAPKENCAYQKEINEHTREGE